MPNSIVVQGYKITDPLSIKLLERFRIRQSQREISEGTEGKTPSKTAVIEDEIPRAPKGDYGGPGD